MQFLLKHFPGKAVAPARVWPGWAQALRMGESEPRPHPRGDSLLPSSSGKSGWDHGILQTISRLKKKFFY